jgi:hypothetical protein
MTSFYTPLLSGDVLMAPHRPFGSAIVAACLLIAAAAILPAQARRTITPRPAFAEPSIAPDGSEIAFVSGGDIWTVSAAGGQARLPISHAPNDTHPVYSPDQSTRPWKCCFGRLEGRHEVR